MPSASTAPPRSTVAPCRSQWSAARSSSHVFPMPGSPARNTTLHAPLTALSKRSWRRVRSGSRPLVTASQPPIRRKKASPPLPAESFTAKVGIQTQRADRFGASQADESGLPRADKSGPYLFPSMRFSLVPQTGQVPCMALRPFFRVTSCAPWMSRFSRHLTQYACSAITSSSLTSSSFLRAFTDFIAPNVPRRGFFVVRCSSFVVCCQSQEARRSMAISRASGEVHGA